MEIHLTPCAYTPESRALRPGDDLAPVLHELVKRAELNHSETARLLGVSRQHIEQQLTGQRTPSLLAFLHTVEACGGRVVIDMPSKERE